MNLDSSMPENVAIGEPANRMNEGTPSVYEFTFSKEEHTLGNLLQTFLVERHIEGTEMPRVKYAGYRVPHPLKQEMVLTISPVDGSVMSARKAIASVCTYLKTYFLEATQEWIKTPKGTQPALSEPPKSKARTKK